MKRYGDKSKHLSIRFDKDTHDKLFYIAEYEGRSGRAQILYLIRKCIAEFERANGPIVLEDEDNG